MHTPELAYDCGAVLAFCAAAFACIAVHEAGHAVTGIALGLRLSGFCIGPLYWWRNPLCEQSHWRFRVRKRVLTGLTSFFGRSIEANHMILRYAIAVFSGPVANLLFAFATMILVIHSRGLDALVGGFTICCSVFYAVANLVPATSKDYLDSDGMVLWKLATSRPYRQSVHAQMCFFLRLERFKAEFAAGRADAASNLLSDMRDACRTPRQKIMRSIVDHLQEHLETGESMETCRWSAVAAQTAATQ